MTDNQSLSDAINQVLERKILDALAGDEFIKTTVMAALNKPVEIRTSTYGPVTKTTFLDHTINEAIQQATSRATHKLVNMYSPAIEEEIAAQLAKRIPQLAKTLTDSLVTATEKGYGLSITIDLTKEEEDDALF